MLKRSEPKKKEFPKLILDSNALFVPLQFKLDIFEELNTLMNANYEPILLSPNRQEIERLAREGSLKTRKEAASRSADINLRNTFNRPFPAPASFLFSSSILL